MNSGAPFNLLLRWALGSILLLLGVIGLFLPVLQGILFLALGALLLSPEIPVLRLWICKIQRKFPKTRAPLRKTKEYLDSR